MSDTSTSDSEWQFQVDDVLMKPDHGMRIEGAGSMRDTTEYRVKYRLADADSGERFYYFSHDEGTYLASAKMVENDWELHTDMEQ